MTDKLTDDIDKLTNLALSVGRQGRKQKVIVPPLTPIEVAQYIRQIKDENNETDSEISKRLGLGKLKSKSGHIMVDMDVKKPNDSQVKIFLKLLKLSEKTISAVGFEGYPNKVPFSVAVLVHNLEHSEQDIMIQNMLKHKLIKNEVIRLLQYKKQYALPIDECIEKVLKIRPEKSTQYMLVYNIPNTVNHILKQLGKSTEDITEKLVKSISQKLNGEIEQVTINESLLIIFTDTTAYKSFEHEMNKNNLTYNQCVKKLLIGEYDE